ncbi:MAG: hypothetical protein P8M80_02420 [Pirellulaceae bacterium]|nr:hypothetical protein [Pirellulaceae bacterium]
MIKNRISILTIAILFSGILTESCQAGPLLDWWRGLRAKTAYRFNNTFRGNNNAFRGNAQTQFSAKPGISTVPAPGTTMCPKVAYQTVNRVVANYVPYTAFRTEWYRVPTTYYRPVTASNPQTGCISTVMQPCTTYQMQARRVPYTTYQTVYRTVQKRIPYTTYVTSFNTAGAAGCNSCGVNPTATPSMVTPYGTPYGTTVPGNISYGLNTNGGFPVPANSTPMLNPGEITPDTTMQRPEIETPSPMPDPTIETNDEASNNPSGLIPPANTLPASESPSTHDNFNKAPAVVHDRNHTASLIRGKWDYSPVRHASYHARIENQSEVVSATAARPSAARPSAGTPLTPFQSKGWQTVKP